MYDATGPNVYAPDDIPDVVLSADDREDIATFRKIERLIDQAQSEVHGLRDKTRARDVLHKVKYLADFVISQIEEINEGAVGDFDEEAA